MRQLLIIIRKIYENLLDVFMQQLTEIYPFIYYSIYANFCQIAYQYEMFHSDSRYDTFLQFGNPIMLFSNEAMKLTFMLVINVYFLGILIFLPWLKKNIEQKIVFGTLAFSCTLYNSVVLCPAIEAALPSLFGYTPIALEVIGVIVLIITLFLSLTFHMFADNALNIYEYGLAHNYCSGLYSCSLITKALTVLLSKVQQLNRERTQLNYGVLFLQSLYCLLTGIDFYKNIPFSCIKKQKFYVFMWSLCTSSVFCNLGFQFRIAITDRLSYSVIYIICTPLIALLALNIFHNRLMDVVFYFPNCLQTKQRASKKLKNQENKDDLTKLAFQFSFLEKQLDYIQSHIALKLKYFSLFMRHNKLCSAAEERLQATANRTESLNCFCQQFPLIESFQETDFILNPKYFQAFFKQQIIKMLQENRVNVIEHGCSNEQINGQTNHKHLYYIKFMKYIERIGFCTFTMHDISKNYTRLLEESAAQEVGVGGSGGSNANPRGIWLAAILKVLLENTKQQFKIISRMKNEQPEVQVTVDNCEQYYFMEHRCEYYIHIVKDMIQRRLEALKLAKMGFSDFDEFLALNKEYQQHLERCEQKLRNFFKKCPCNKSRSILSFFLNEVKNDIKQSYEINKMHAVNSFEAQFMNSGLINVFAPSNFALLVGFGRVKGKILWYSNNAPRQFGYSMREFQYIDSLNDLLPDELGFYHNQLVELFLQTGNTNMFRKIQQGFIKTKYGWIDKVDIFIDINFHVQEDLAFFCFLRKKQGKGSREAQQFQLVDNSYTIFLDYEGFIKYTTRNLLQLTNIQNFDIKDTLYTLHINLLIPDFASFISLMEQEQSDDASGVSGNRGIGGAGGASSNATTFAINRSAKTTIISQNQLKVEKCSFLMPLIGFFIPSSELDLGAEGSGQHTGSSPPTSRFTQFKSFQISFTMVRIKKQVLTKFVHYYTLTIDKIVEQQKLLQTMQSQTNTALPTNVDLRQFDSFKDNEKQLKQYDQGGTGELRKTEENIELIKNKAQGRQKRFAMGTRDKSRKLSFVPISIQNQELKQTNLKLQQLESPNERLHTSFKNIFEMVKMKRTGDNLQLRPVSQIKDNQLEKQRSQLSVNQIFDLIGKNKSANQLVRKNSKLISFEQVKMYHQRKAAEEAAAAVKAVGPESKDAKGLDSPNQKGISDALHEKKSFKQSISIDTSKKSHSSKKNEKVESDSEKSEEWDGQSVSPYVYNENLSLKKQKTGGDVPQQQQQQEEAGIVISGDREEANFKGQLQQVVALNGLLSVEGAIDTKNMRAEYKASLNSLSMASSIQDERLPEPAEFDKKKVFVVKKCDNDPAPAPEDDLNNMSYNNINNQSANDSQMVLLNFQHQQQQYLPQIPDSSFLSNELHQSSYINGDGDDRNLEQLKEQQYQLEEVDDDEKRKIETEDIEVNEKGQQKNVSFQQIREQDEEEEEDEDNNKKNQKAADDINVYNEEYLNIVTKANKNNQGSSNNLSKHYNEQVSENSQSKSMKSRQSMHTQKSFKSQREMYKKLKTQIHKVQNFVNEDEQSPSIDHEGVGGRLANDKENNKLQAIINNNSQIESQQQQPAESGGMSKGLQRLNSLAKHRSQQQQLLQKQSKQQQQLLLQPQKKKQQELEMQQLLHKQAQGDENIATTLAKSQFSQKYDEISEFLSDNVKIQAGYFLHLFKFLEFSCLLVSTFSSLIIIYNGFDKYLDSISTIQLESNVMMPYSQILAGTLQAIAFWHEHIETQNLLDSQTLSYITAIIKRAEINTKLIDDLLHESYRNPHIREILINRNINLINTHYLQKIGEKFDQSQPNFINSVKYTDIREELSLLTACSLINQYLQKNSKNMQRLYEYAIKSDNPNEYQELEVPKEKDNNVMFLLANFLKVSTFFEQLTAEIVDNLFGISSSLVQSLLVYTIVLLAIIFVLFGSSYIAKLHYNKQLYMFIRLIETVTEQQLLIELDRINIMQELTNENAYTIFYEYKFDLRIKETCIIGDSRLESEARYLPDSSKNKNFNNNLKKKYLSVSSESLSSHNYILNLIVSMLVYGLYAAINLYLNINYFSNMDAALKFSQLFSSTSVHVNSMLVNLQIADIKTFSLHNSSFWYLITEYGLSDDFIFPVTIEYYKSYQRQLVDNVTSFINVYSNVANIQLLSPDFKQQLLNLSQQDICLLGRQQQQHDLFPESSLCETALNGLALKGALPLLVQLKKDIAIQLVNTARTKPEHLNELIILCDCLSSILKTISQTFQDELLRITSQIKRDFLIHTTIFLSVFLIYYALQYSVVLKQTVKEFNLIKCLVFLMPPVTLYTEDLFFKKLKTLNKQHGRR